MHLSKATQGIPMPEGCSLAWDDAVMCDFSMQLSKEEKREEERITSGEMKDVALKTSVGKLRVGVKRKTLVLAAIDKVRNLMAFRTRTVPHGVPKDILPEPFEPRSFSRSA